MFVPKSEIIRTAQWNRYTNHLTTADVSSSIICEVFLIFFFNYLTKLPKKKELNTLFPNAS